jgi:hypothetical protein
MAPVLGHRDQAAEVSSRLLLNEYKTDLCMFVIASMLHTFDELHVLAPSSIKEFVLDIGGIGLGSNISNMQNATRAKWLLPHICLE